MHKYSKVRWSTTSGLHTKSDCLGLSPRLRTALGTVACGAIGMAIIATAVGSLTQKSAWALPIASIDRTPPPAIDIALATPRASSINTAETSHPWAKDSCADFDFSFLNSVCSKIRMKHARRIIHRKATFVIGNSDASPSSVTAQARPIPSSSRTGN